MEAREKVRGGHSHHQRLNDTTTESVAVLLLQVDLVLRWCVVVAAAVVVWMWSDRGRQCSWRCRKLEHARAASADRLAGPRKDTDRTRWI